MTVYFYTEKEHSDYFKELLQSNSISYEYQLDDESGKHYFGIKKVDVKHTKKLNFLVFAKFRKPFISSSIFKFILVSVTLLCILLGIIGYLKR